MNAKATTGTITATDFAIGPDNYVKGALTGDVTRAALEVNGTKLTTINVSGSSYQYYAKNNITKATDEVYIIGYDAAGKELQRTKVNVIAATAGTITANDFTVGTDNYVKGNLTGDVTRAALEVNGTALTTINVSGSTYQYYASKNITKATDEVYIIGYDAAGKELQRTKVNVKAPAATKGTITADKFYLGDDGYVKGALTGDVARVSLTVNGTELTKINVSGSTYQYYARTSIKNLTDVVVVTAYDTAGKVLDSKTVTITTDNGLTGSITANNFKFGKDRYVTGTLTGDIVRVELQVNGVALQRIGVSGSTYQYYASAAILNSTDEVKVVGYNSAGVAVSTKTVAITTTDGTVVANDYVIGKDSYVTGTLTGDVTKIALKVNGEIKGSIPATAGAFQYYANSTVIKSDTDVVEVVAYDAAGSVLSTATVKVSKTVVVSKGTVTPASFKVGTDRYVTGTFTGDVARVELEVNGVLKGKIPATGGVISYYAAAAITSDTDVVNVVVYNAAGVQLDKKPVSLKSNVGTVTVEDYKIGSARLTGTVTGDVTKVSVEVNGTELSTIPAANGEFSYYIAGKITDEADVVKVIGKDALGNKVTEQIVNVSK
ncbi:hypothetical protein PWEIH_02689 [Listeria weihenstephanensis FSL R9-0317]|uniref:immunoglobulin-like domain-containing protein n=1 Tax=Listeria weihenstephanensis TaxID=1006155 RepID=UPI0003E85588|nr:immunoglobulin-like domain-containing protein [Listeria weihenstephanensis]EUJ40918.1 hypothetical protein PWEIH_02689 [Listeria weihenstephanensis FSL R9-0317]